MRVLTTYPRSPSTPRATFIYRIGTTLESVASTGTFDGKPLESQTELQPKREVIVKEPTAWWETAWDSVKLAGEELAGLCTGLAIDARPERRHLIADRGRVREQRQRCRQ